MQALYEEELKLIRGGKPQSKAASKIGMGILKLKLGTGNFSLFRSAGKGEFDAHGYLM